jgi:hypothetical protein
MNHPASTLNPHALSQQALPVPARTIELVRDAFLEAMRDEGITPRTRINISTRAQHHINFLLQDDATGD